MLFVILFLLFALCTVFFMLCNAFYTHTMQKLGAQVTFHVINK